jgi:hypothetical protein
MTKCSSTTYCCNQGYLFDCCSDDANILILGEGNIFGVIDGDGFVAIGASVSTSAVSEIPTATSFIVTTSTVSLAPATVASSFASTSQQTGTSSSSSSQHNTTSSSLSSQQSATSTSSSAQQSSALPSSNTGPSIGAYLQLPIGIAFMALII